MDASESGNQQGARNNMDKVLQHYIHSFEANLFIFDSGHFYVSIIEIFDDGLDRILIVLGFAVHQVNVAREVTHRVHGGKCCWSIVRNNEQNRFQKNRRQRETEKDLAEDLEG